MGGKIQVGIIGAGFGATVHAPMMLNHPGFEVVALSTVSRSHVKEIKKETGIDKVYDDWRKMLSKENLDLVSITSAPFLHQEMVLEAFEHHLHVLCEKPMALNGSESVKMIEKKNEANRLGLINFEFRFLPARMKVKEIMDSGQLGRILHIHYRGIYQGYYRNFKRKNWLGQREKGGGMLGALGSHMFDALLWWKKSKIEMLYGQLPIHFPEFVDKNGEKERRTADDAFQVVGYFVDGTTFTVDFILSNRNTSGWLLEVHGTNGTLVMKDDQQVYFALGDQGLKEMELQGKDLIPPEHLSDYTKKYYPAFHPMLDQLYQAVEKHQLSPHLATFEDGHQVQLILDAIRKSADEGRKVPVGSLN